MYNLGSVHANLGEEKEAKTYLEGALELIRASKNVGLTASTLYKLGALYDDPENPKKAEEFYEQSLRIYRSQKDNKVLVNVLNNLGVKKGQIGSYIEAESNLQEALMIIQENGDSKSSALILNNIGVSLIGLNKFDKAFSSLNTALEGHMANDDTVSMIGTLNNLAVAASGEDRIQDSEGYLDKALQEIAGINKTGGSVNKQHVHSVLDNMGKIRFRMNHLIDDLFSVLGKDTKYDDIDILKGWQTIKRGYEMAEAGNWEKAYELISSGEKLMNEGDFTELSSVIWQNMEVEGNYVD